MRPNVLMPPPFPRKPGYNNPRESPQLMPPPAPRPMPVGRDVKKPSPTRHLESQLMPPPAVIPCEPPVTMRQVGDLMSANLRQGKQKEEIGKTRTCGPGRPAACTVIGSILSLQIRITRTVFVDSFFVLLGPTDSRILLNPHQVFDRSRFIQ